MQGSCPKGAVSNYAKIVRVAIPQINQDGDIVPTRSKHKPQSKVHCGSSAFLEFLGLEFRGWRWENPASAFSVICHQLFSMGTFLKGKPKHGEEGMYQLVLLPFPENRVLVHVNIACRVNGNVFFPGILSKQVRLDSWWFSWGEGSCPFSGLN